MFGFTIIKTSKVEDLECDKVALTTRCKNLTDEVTELRAKIDRMTGGLRQNRKAKQPA